MVTSPQQLAYSGAFPTGHFIHISGPQTIAPDTLRVLEELILENYGPHPRPSPIRRKTVVPPAPRLVGIETNPGPNGSKSVRRGISTAEKALAIIDTLRQGRLIPPMKSPAKKKKKSTGSGRTLSLTSTSSLSAVNAPISRALRSTSNLSHTPFIMKGRSIAFAVGLSATSVPNILGLSGTISANWFNVDPASNSANVTNLACFPAAIRNVALSFQRYRFRRLTLDYAPTSSTSSPNSIVLAVLPENGVNSAATISTQDVSSFQVNLTTPVWNPVMGFDLLAEGGLRKDWCFVATETSASRSTERQESPGIIAFAALGPLVNNAVYGWIYFNYEIEFTGVGLESAFSMTPTPSLATSSAQPSIVHEPEYGVVYGPQQQQTLHQSPPMTRNFASSMGL